MELSDLDLPVLVSLVGQAVDRRVLAAVQAQHPGLRVVHGYVFQRLLVEQPTVTELAVSLEVSQQLASRWVRELVGGGYVVRERDAADRRAWRLALSERGLAAVELAREVRAELAASCGEEGEARRVLERLLEAAGGVEAVRGRRVPVLER